MGAFLKRLRRFVLDEAESQRRELFKTWAKPLPQRVADGQAIEGVRIVRADEAGRLELACERNRSRFREGDVLCLNRGSPQSQPQLMVTLEEDDETRLVVSCEELGISWGEWEQEQEGWALDAGYLDLSQWVLDALDEAGDSWIGRERILPLLLGATRPRSDSLRYERGLQMGEAFGLNWSQAEALAQAYATDLTYLIQGPPGTGKTRVLAHLAQALASDGERVLISAFTHRAINNALNKLEEVDPTVAAIKVGRRSRTDGLRVENYESFDSSPMAEMSDGYVIGATPFAPRTRRLSGVEFDTVIFDEASQITLPLALMGMLPAQKYIFIGDQHQLPPVLTTRLSGGALRESVFGFLVDQGFDTMLTETYRLNAGLTEWPNRHFYNGMLAPVAEVAGRRLRLPRPAPRLGHLLDPGEPRIFWDLGHRNNTTRSHQEASAVIDLIDSLLKAGVAAGEIGVVVPYRNQAREIRNRLRATVPQVEQRRQIVVDTVERMQGQERDVVILSLTTSNLAFAADLADFFFQPQRLNVAVTRPRMKLIVVGSRHVLKAEPRQVEEQEAVALLADLLNSCTRFQG